MTVHRDHPRDAIQDFLDGRLGPAERAALESHLSACESCRAEEQALREVRQAVRTGLPPIELPAGLDDSLSAALDGVAGSVAEPRSAIVRRPRYRVLLAAAAIVVLALFGIWRSRDRRDPVDLATALGQDFERTVGGTLPLSLPVTAPAELERRFAAEGIPFPTHVYDLGMMGFTLSGGRVHSVAGRPSALFAYRAANGPWLICQMYPGTTDELPAGSDVRTRDGIRFHTFRRGAVTVVFWQEGAIVCALASDLPTAQVVELALAKAMKV